MKVPLAVSDCNDPMGNFSTTTSSPVILVCDDDHDARSLIASTVEALGYRVIEAVDGVDALEKCESTVPDLILLDIMMPRMDGFEFLRAFRAKENLPFIPVLLLTALDQTETRVEGLAGGADDYVTKPFQYRELQARIQALLRTKQLTETLRLRTKQLEEANHELKATQEQLLQKERELTATRITGTAAHNLGQPLTTIMLNLFVLEKAFRQMVPSDQTSSTPASQTSEFARPSIQSALEAIKTEANAMREILGKLQAANPDRTKNYVGEVKIVDLETDNE